MTKESQQDYGLCNVMSDLRRWKAPSTRGAVRQHLLVATSVARASRGRLVHCPVPGAKDLLEDLGEFRVSPVLLTHGAWGLPGQQWDRD